MRRVVFTLAAYLFSSAPMLANGFKAGTLILTKQGEVKVESLRASHTIVGLTPQGERTEAQIQSKVVLKKVLVKLRFAKAKKISCSIDSVLKTSNGETIVAADVKPGTVLCSDEKKAMQVVSTRLLGELPVYDLRADSELLVIANKKLFVNSIGSDLSIEHEIIDEGADLVLPPEELIPVEATCEIHRFSVE